MNIIDLLGSSKPSEDELPKKVAIKAEIQKIEARSKDLIRNYLEFVLDEIKSIKNNLAYPYCSSTVKSYDLTDEEKNTIIQKLYDSTIASSERIKKEIDDLNLSKSEESSKEEGSKDDKPEETEKLEVVAVQPAPVAKTPNYFEY